MSSPITNYGQDQHSGSGPIMLSQATPEVRTAFLAKVYGLLFVGIAAYFLSIGIPMAGWILGIPGLQEFANFFIFMSPLVALVLIIAVSFFASAIQGIPGLNLLGFFSIAAVYGFLSLSLVAIALTIGIEPNADGSITMSPSNMAPGLIMIGQAFLITVFSMGGLTAYVLLAKKDFSFMGGFLWAGFFLLFGIAVAAMLFSFFGAQGFLGVSFDIIHTAISAAFVILFLGFVLYDTSKILHHYPTSAVVPAALTLLIDFIILFRNILWLLIARRR